MQTKMADAHKAIGEDMGKEAADELKDMQGHQFFFTVIAVVEIFEGDGIFANGDNAMIWNRDAENVATQIFDQLFFVVEWFLDIMS